MPIIAVGNLSIGGAGKTPHIEYLIRLLRPYLNISTLSRGYKRKSKGFRFINARDSVLVAGDEPLQYKRKYNDIIVAVSESRTLAIPMIMKHVPATQVILLDDAFQHRAIIPGLNMLLTTFDNPFTGDILLPAGRLREFPDAYKRADIIIISKCPDDLDQETAKLFVEKINPLDHQRIYFSKYHYFPPYSMFNPTQTLTLSSDLDIVLVSAIANTEYLLDYLSEIVSDVHELEYEDHHLFSERDIEYIAQVYENREASHKIILTTEKDAMRLDMHRQLIHEKSLPIYILPVEVRFLFEQSRQFNNQIKSFLLNFKV